MRRYGWIAIIGLLTAASAFAQQQVPEPTDTVPHEQLQQLYQQELGDKYDPASTDRYVAAHQLLERYFAATTSDQRKATTAQLEASGLEAAILGRLARIRMNWPQFAGGGVFYINERFGPHDVRYFIGVPKAYQRTTSWPLVVKLPTAHAFLTSPAPTPDQVVRTYTQWIEEELQQHPDAIVLMPLLNLDELWGPSYAGMASAIQPMLHVAGRLNIDPARVCLIGHSMSGHAVWNLGLHYPTYLAAINPLAGGATGDWQRLRMMNLRNVLPVVWHDADDRVLDVQQSRELVNILRRQKIDVVYEETEDLGHAPPAAITDRLYQTMRARRRDLYPQRLTLQSNRPDSLFNRSDWIQVYQMMRTGKEQRALIAHGSGRMITYQNTFTVDSTRSPLPLSSRIEMTCNNVASLRIYLNDQMIDFAKPLTLVVNRRVRFEGMVKPSIDEMLKDQMFLGRGWRYFTAVVDIDLLDSPAGGSGTRPTTGAATRRGVIEYMAPGSTELKRIEVP